MSATMASQGGQVHLQQSNMLLALNMAIMAKGGILCSGIEETHHLLKNFPVKFQEEKKPEDEFPGHHNMTDKIVRHQAMLWENQTNGCLLCENGTALNLKTC
jgi:hypothetical protein